MLFVLTDLGSGQWEAETVSYWTHQYSAWCGSQHSQPLSLLLWRRQASQVLGSGVQQGMLFKSEDAALKMTAELLSFKDHKKASYLFCGVAVFS